MKEDKFTLIISKGNIKYKICKVIFGPDGSYYVTVPYHKEKKAFFLKYKKCFKSQKEFNHTTEFQLLFETDAVDVASVDNKILKLSHHPDGFVQFSGKGVISGKNTNGDIKGIGLQSWLLEKPAPGPSFGLAIQGIQDFDIATPTKEHEIIFEDNVLVGTDRTNGYMLEGFYFPERARRFIDENKMISFLHPDGFVLRLKVILPNEKCKIQGFMGLNCLKAETTFTHAKSAFSLSGSTQFIKKRGPFRGSRNRVYVSKIDQKSQRTFFGFCW